VNHAAGISYATKYTLPNSPSAQAIAILQRDFPAASGDADQIVVEARTRFPSAGEPRRHRRGRTALSEHRPAGGPDHQAARPAPQPGGASGRGRRRPARPDRGVTPAQADFSEALARKLPEFVAVVVILVFLLIVDAFVVRTVLVPALMHLCGRANWWLPGWLDRGLPHLAVDIPDVTILTTHRGGVPCQQGSGTSPSTATTS
jgi:hypothetical protein